jgi:NAD(P)-dependent dehydrogenase (short-subunit alcohol dehydrogenase family)
MARIFITGSTDGLGRAAARTLLDDGHRVVLHARTAARAASVDDLALRAAGVVVGDLASAEETGRVADQVNAIGRMDAELAAGGFLDAVWVGRWDVVFAGSTWRRWRPACGASP